MGSIPTISTLSLLSELRPSLAATTATEDGGCKYLARRIVIKGKNVFRSLGGGGLQIIYLFKKLLINNQIRSPRVRVIDETGKQLGIMPLQEALQIARGRNLDLMQVTERVEPPVCKLMDYGKYIYSEQKKARKEAQKQKSGQLKQIRISLGISPHDLEVKAIQAKKFLKRGDKVRIEMRLRGREKSFGQLAREKMSKFTEILKGSVAIKIERELKKEPRGLTIIISKG